MIFSEKNTNSSTNASGTNFSFNITSHSFSFVTKDLYEYPIRAIIRELASNAIDANRAAGKSPMDWTIKLPTVSDPVFLIEDKGDGLSSDDMKNIYPVMFKSTRSNTNDSIGMFGLGCKTPFNYTSQYTVISCHKGFKNIYSVYKENGTPKLSDPLNPEPIPTTQSGLTVSFPVNIDDFKSFYKEFVYVAAGWDSLPNIINKSCIDQILDGESLEEQCRLFNGPIVPSKSVSSIFRVNSGYGLYVEMGNVLYPVTFSSETDCLKFYRENVKSSDYIYVIHANIGDVNVVPSREKLLFDVENKTLSYIERAISGLYLLKFDYKSNIKYRTDYYYRHADFIPNIEAIKSKDYPSFNLFFKNLFDDMYRVIKEDFNLFNKVKSSLPEYTSILTTYATSASTATPKLYLTWCNTSDILELFCVGKLVGVSTESDKILKAVNTVSRGVTSKFLRSGIQSYISGKSDSVKRFLISNKETLEALKSAGIEIVDIITGFEEVNVKATKTDQFSLYDVEVIEYGHTKTTVKLPYHTILETMKNYDHNFAILNKRGKVAIVDINYMYDSGTKFSSSNNAITTEFYSIIKSSSNFFKSENVRFVSFSSKDLNQNNIIEDRFEPFFEYFFNQLSSKATDIKSNLSKVDRTKFFASLSSDAKELLESYSWGKDSIIYNTYLQTKNLNDEDFNEIKVPYSISVLIEKFPTVKRTQFLKDVEDINAVIHHNDFDSYLIDTFPMLKYVVDFYTFASISWRNSDAQLDAINYIAEVSGAKKKK